MTAIELMRTGAGVGVGRNCTQFAETGKVLATRSMIKKVENGSPFLSSICMLGIMKMAVLHPGLLLNLDLHFELASDPEKCCKYYICFVKYLLHALRD